MRSRPSLILEDHQRRSCIQAPSRCCLTSSMLLKTMYEWWPLIVSQNYPESKATFLLLSKCWRNWFVKCKVDLENFALGEKWFDAMRWKWKSVKSWQLLKIKPRTPALSCKCFNIELQQSDNQQPCANNWEGWWCNRLHVLLDAWISRLIDNWTKGP